MRFLGIWILLAFGAAPASAADLESSVVRISATKRPADVESPWQWQKASSAQFLGVVLAGGEILTTAYTVWDSVDLEMQRFGGGERFELAVKFVDYEVNLALLVPENPKALQGLVPLSVGAALPLGTDVDIFKRRNDYRLTQIPGRFLEMGVYSAVTSSYVVASYLIKVQQTGMGWAEPVVAQGKLVALSSGQDSNYVHAIPATVINHFLQDIRDGDYLGFPAMGISLSALESPEARKYYGADSISHGLRVSKVAPTSPLFEKVLSNDILLAVNGHQVSEHGYFTDPLYGPLPLMFLMNQLYAGDKVALKLLRKGEPLRLQASLERYDSFEAPVLSGRPGKKEPHLIFGGLVFQELSVPYMHQFGQDWQNLAPFDLLYILSYENDVRQKPYRYIVVSRVLADEFNRGYEKIRHAVVKEVNGVAVGSLEDVRKALKTEPISMKGRPYARISLMRDEGEILLDYEGVAAAHKRIAETYSITTADSFF